MRGLRSLRALGSILFLLGTLMVILLVSHKVHAVNFVLPDYDYFSAGPNVHLEIAQTGNGRQITLDAPETWVKLFFDPNVGGNQIGVQMAAAAFTCNPSNPDSYFQIDSQGLSNNCSDPNAVDYNFYCADSSGKNPNFGSLFYSINSGDTKFSGPGYKQVFDGPTFQRTSPCALTGVGAQARYVVYVQATWRGASPPEGRINGFKVGGSVAGSLASYWASGTGYAVQNRIDKMPGEDAYLNFEFAPQCSDPPTQLASLIWKDADASSNGGAPPDGGSFAGDNEPSFDLFEGDPGGSGWVKMATVNSRGTTAFVPLTITAANIGGNGDTRQLQFTARNDKIYSWKWYNVNYNNGVQMTLPFDSYYYTKKCAPPVVAPPAPTVSTSCQSDGTTKFTVMWDPANTPAGTTRYFTDVNNANSFPAAGGYWNKGPMALGTNSTSGPGGFNTWPGGSPAMPPLAPGVDYYARIYYDGPSGIASAVSVPFRDVCPPPVLSCTSINPAMVETGETNIDFRVSIFNQPGRAGLVNSSAVITINGLDSPPYSITPALSPNTLTVVHWNPYTAPASPGEYPVTVRFNGGNSPAGNLTCPGKLLVVNKPYVRVFGGDIIAGSTAGCSAWQPNLASSTGGILAFSNSAGKGSGTQLAAQALSTIIGFSSAQGRSAFPTSDTGLTFANNSGIFGGNFRLGDCPPDYFADRNISTVPVPLSYTTTTASGTYFSTSSPTTIAGGTIGNGKKITAYVDGNVYITGNITYQAGPWALPDDIPSFVLVAKGDIIVAPGVTNLEGVFIAQPTGATTGGTIRTCDTLAGLSLLQRATTDCNAKLTFIGSVTARRINLQRVSGTVKEATSNDCPIAVVVYTGCGPVSTAAEQFIYAPEIWIRSNNTYGPSNPAKFDSISTLSPIY